MFKAKSHVIAVAGIKGGQGKTTIAVNIAIELSRAGHSTCLIDADKQLTASTFTDFRSQELEGHTGYQFMQFIQMKEKTLYAQIMQLRDKYEFVIIDCHGGDNQEHRMAVAASDIILIPVKPRAMDFWSVTQMSRFVEDVRAFNPTQTYRAYSFLSIADRISEDNRTTAELLMGADGIEYIDSPIVNRKAWATAAGHGLGIMEYMDAKDEQKYADSKAVKEFEKLFKHILAQTKTIA